MRETERPLARNIEHCVPESCSMNGKRCPKEVIAAVLRAQTLKLGASIAKQTMDVLVARGQLGLPPAMLPIGIARPLQMLQDHTQHLARHPRPLMIEGPSCCYRSQVRLKRKVCSLQMDLRTNQRRKHGEYAVENDDSCVKAIVSIVTTRSSNRRHAWNSS